MSADYVFFWANWILVGALVVGVLATYAIVVSGNIKEEHLKHELKEKDDAFDKYKIDAGKKIADANAVGETARAQAEVAKADAAEANKKAEAERLERLKLEAIVAPRRLTSEQQTAIASALGSFAGRKVRVRSYGLDVDAAVLGQQIMTALQSAKIVVDDRRMSDQSLGLIVTGVYVTGSDDAFVRAMFGAFSSLGELWRRSKLSHKEPGCLSAMTARLSPPLFSWVLSR